MLEKVGVLVQHDHGLAVPPQRQQRADRRVPVLERQRRGRALVRSDPLAEIAQRLGARPADRVVVEPSRLLHEQLEEERLSDTPAPPHDPETRRAPSAGGEAFESSSLGLAADHVFRVVKRHGTLLLGYALVKYT